MANKSTKRYRQVDTGDELMTLRADLMTLMEAQAKILSLLKKTDFEQERKALNESSSAYLERLHKSYELGGTEE